MLLIGIPTISRFAENLEAVRRFSLCVLVLLLELSDRRLLAARVRDQPTYLQFQPLHFLLQPPYPCRYSGLFGPGIRERQRDSQEQQQQQYNPNWPKCQQLEDDRIWFHRKPPNIVSHQQALRAAPIRQSGERRSA
jgi:hypothetical protein